MEKDIVMEVKNYLIQFADYCKVYRTAEIELAATKRDLNKSIEIIQQQRTQGDELYQQVRGFTLVDTDAIKQEIATLSTEKSQLGFFAFRRKNKVDALLAQKQKELSEATQKNELLTKVQERKKAFSVLYEKERDKQEKLKNDIAAKDEQIHKVAELIKRCEEKFSTIPEEALFYLVSDSGADMAYLPISILRRVVAKGIPEFVKDMPVQNQVKLLYSYDTPICFGGREWNVLEIKGNKALLLLRNAYTCPKYYRKKYSGEKEPCAANAFQRGEHYSVTWENSEARKILNNDFIQSLHLKQGEHILPGDNGDQVFCLSRSEVERYLEPYQRRIEGAWWLRDTTFFRSCYSGGELLKSFTAVSHVSMSGEIDDAHSDSYTNKSWDSQNMCFRPALWVELPYDSLDTEWNEKNISINCKGKWTTDICQSSTPIDVSAALRSLTEKKERKTSDSSDDDAWHAIASGMMGGSGIDGTGV